jgi:RsiW-degrading membrane proteinase PrsW (M82 family)
VTAAPPESPVKPRRKWLGRYGGWTVFAIIAALWAYFLFAQFLVWHYRSEVPIIFALGSFAVAGLVIYQMCYRLTPADGIRPRFLLLVFFVGGFIAYIVSRVIEPLYFGALGGNYSYTPLAYTWLATPTEDVCKIAVVLLAARWVAVKNARTGLFIGGAVGLGFAAYENIEKIFATYVDIGGGIPKNDLTFVPIGGLFARLTSGIAFNTGLREVLTPVAHPIWTALLAAAIFAAYRSRWRVTPSIIIVFLSIAVVHGLWDFLPQIFNLVIPQSAVILSYVVYAVFGVAGAIVWNAVRRRANRGAAIAATPPDPPTEISDAVPTVARQT